MNEQLPDKFACSTRSNLSVGEYIAPQNILMLTSYKQVGANLFCPQLVRFDTKIKMVLTLKNCGEVVAKPRKMNLAELVTKL